MCNSSVEIDIAGSVNLNSGAEFLTSKTWPWLDFDVDPALSSAAPLNELLRQWIAGSSACVVHKSVITACSDSLGKKIAPFL